MGGGGSKIEENNIKGHRKSKSDLLLAKNYKERPNINDVYNLLKKRKIIQ